MAYGYINENGVLVSANTKIEDRFVELSIFQQEDGTYAKWYTEDGQPDTDRIEAELANELAVQSKKDKVQAIDELVVEVIRDEGTEDELVLQFQADDASRANMQEAITAAAVLELTENPWKLADNSIVVVTVDEIKEALAKGIVAKGAIILGE